MALNRNAIDRFIAFLLSQGCLECFDANPARIIQFTVAALIPGPWGPVSPIDDTRERDPQPNASKRPAGRFRNSRADRRWATGGFACPWRQKWHYTAPAQSAENPARPRRTAAQTSRTSVADAL